MSERDREDSGLGQSFGGWADDYEKYRPSYPEGLWDHLLRDDPGRVLDLGAGTGRVSVELLRRGVDVTAVDPDPEMLAQARRAAAAEGYDLHTQVGTAESTGLEDAAFDRVVVAQAFHWFDPAPALREIHRILRPGGRLAAWWNQRPRTVVPWMEEYEALLIRSNPDYHGNDRARDWVSVFTHSGDFERAARLEFPNPIPSTVEYYVGYASTASYVRGGLSKEALARFQEDLRELLVRHHGSGPDGTHFEIPLTVEYVEAE